MTDPKPKVVDMCGRAVPLEPADGEDPEAGAARVQLTHWAHEATSYVGLFLTEDSIAFASSSEDPGRILAMATMVYQRAQAYAVAALCDECGIEPDGDEDDPDDAG